jgi:parvulin-like peptidyl-prolyl isomerase
MRNIVYLCAVLVLTVLAGCWDGAEPAAATPEASEEGIARSYSSLATNDVLVSVDGVDLTKQDAERRLDMTLALVRANGHFQGNARDPNVRAIFLRRIVPQFISETILLKAARGDGIKPSQDSVDQARNDIVSAFGDKGLSFEEFAKRIPARQRAEIDEAIVAAATIYDYIKAKLGDRATVTEHDIDEVVEFAEAKKAESNKAMVKQREKAKELYRRLVDGEEFTSVAKESFTADDDNSDGTWGEFQSAAIESLYPGILKSLAPLKPGEFTEPVEFDDGLYIIQLVSREGHGEPSVFTSQPETLTLRRIVVALPVMIEVATRAAIRHDLLAERMSRFQKEELLPSLSKKAKISWPNGKISYASKVKQSKQEKTK